REGGLKKYIYMPPQRSLIAELLRKQYEMEKADKDSRPCQKDNSYFSIDLQLADSRESQSISTAIESSSYDNYGISTAQSPSIQTAKSPELSDLDVYDGDLRLMSERSESMELPSEVKNSNNQDALNIFVWNQRKKKCYERMPTYKESDYCFTHYKS
uniref:Uncharacterized protein n=1 Tax=Parascaris univalens TaxID=6257 RepID=A0A914ZDF6_PARUN